MDLTLGEFSILEVKRSGTSNTFDGSLDIQSLNMLMLLDQPKTIEAAAKEAGYQLEDVKERLETLIKALEVVDGKGKVLPSGFIEFLKVQLTNAVGPLAVMLMEDVAYDLGHEINYFPISEAAELCRLLAEEIKRKDQAVDFERKVTAKLTTYQ